jgi:5'-3' exonuclease
MQRILIIDTGYICHRIKFSRRRQILGGWEKAFLNTFLEYLIDNSKKLKINRIVFAWDDMQSKREVIYPAYKAHRKNKVMSEEDKKLNKICYPFFDDLKELLLPELGFANNFVYEGLEADDIIADISYRERQRGEVVILSSDNDLYQLLHQNVTIYNGTKFYTHRTLMGEYKIKPNTWIKIKAIAGCRTDNVKGVEGVGVKRAISYLKGKMDKKSAYYRKIENNQGMILSNLRLVQLPFETTPHFHLREDQLDPFYFEDICRRYKLPVVKRIKEWEEVICSGEIN